MKDVSFSKTAASVDPEARIGFDGTPTTIEVTAVEALRNAVIPQGTKGMPFRGDKMTLAELGATGWNVLAGRFVMPILVLKGAAIDLNVRAMADYCRSHGVWLSPHGKTTMASQVFRSQIEAGACAMTAATPAQLRL